MMVSFSFHKCVKDGNDDEDDAKAKATSGVFRTSVARASEELRPW